MPTRRQLIAFGMSAAAVQALPQTARSQGYPTRPITIVVPFPPGGAADTIARLIADQMHASLGQPVVIENVTGAAGSLGPGRVARAASDGYTLSLGTSGTHVVNGAMLALSYDVVADFAPIALLTTQPLMIVARKDMPAKDLGELIAWLRTHPDKASQGTSGVGSTIHLTGLLFQKLTGTRFAFVPYRGTNLAMQDMIAGRIDLMFDLASLSIPHVRAGAVKPYAVMANGRLAIAPDVPTVDEAGLHGFYGAIWIGLWARSGTPKEAITRLNTSVVEALANSAVRVRLTNLGHDIFPREQQTPEALAALQKSEIDKWWPIIKAAGIKAN